MKKWILISLAFIIIGTAATVFANEYEQLKYNYEIVQSEFELMQGEYEQIKDIYNLVQSENTLKLSENKTLQQQMNELIIIREQEKEQFKEAIEMERLVTFVESKPEDEEVPGLVLWENANEIADYFYEDSDGRFDRDWGLFLAMEAMQKEIDPFIVYELLRVETGGQFDPEVVGPQTRYGHAYGLAQFMHNTSPWIAEMANLPEYDHDMLFDPLYSIQLAVTYLDFLYSQYGDWDHALTAYHRGIYGMQRYKAENGHARSWYAAEIQEKAQGNRNLVATN
ncbi:MAG: transglycosylase SLT domain-containing protein [Bacillus sp. (in: Bacteria)]|nr:transglycosylase SLT domain-containing protein [Bacillus sp. (in: firmicutes)]